MFLSLSSFWVRIKKIWYSSAGHPSMLFHMNVEYPACVSGGIHNVRARSFTFQVILQRQLHKPPRISKFGIPRPPAHRNLVVHCLDIHKASGFKPSPLHIVRQHCKRPANLLPRLGAHASPHREGRVGINRVVVTDKVNFDLSALNPAPWLQSPEGFTEQARPVSYRAKQVADMDEVEGCFGPGPRLCGIVDLEVNVWWDPLRLRRR